MSVSAAWSVIIAVLAALRRPRTPATSSPEPCQDHAGTERGRAFRALALEGDGARGYLPVAVVREAVADASLFLPICLARSQQPVVDSTRRPEESLISRA